MRYLYWIVLLFLVIFIVGIGKVLIVPVREWSEIRVQISSSCKKFVVSDDPQSQGFASEQREEIKKSWIYYMANLIWKDFRFYLMEVPTPNGSPMSCWTGWVNYWGKPAIVVYMNDLEGVEFYKVYDPSWK